MTQTKLHEIYVLERIAGKDTLIHHLNPAVKLIYTLIFIIITASFDRYSFTAMMPLLLIPVILASIADIPFRILASRLLITLPFSFFAGVSNIIYETDIAFIIGNVTVSLGLLSFMTIILKTLLSVFMVLLLLGTTPFVELTYVFRRIKIPEIFITTFELTYRYIGILGEEIILMRNAYSLRNGNKNNIDFKYYGQFIGQLLLRSFDRAERVYGAMKLRGYSTAAFYRTDKKLRLIDIVFTVILIVLLISFRLIGILNVNY